MKNLEIVLWLKKRPLLVYAGCVLVMTMISIVYVTLHSTAYINVEKRNTNSEYNFFSFDTENVTIENTSSITNIIWKDIESHFYISSFDMNLSTMPSEAFHEIASIPEGTNEIQVDMTIGGTYNDLPIPSYQSHFYLITYNEFGKVDSMNERLVFDHNTRSRLRSFKLKVSPEAKYYKMLFRVKADTGISSSGRISVSNIDTIFR